MSTIDKMLIKGIRSFDPENKHVITFFRPLTLIVGPNGAGKTTIIECLKQACTGELPPNSRSGHTFVHDPKVSGETETKGQIKLRFKTAAGRDVVCIRSFQLTQKASKMEFKALESVLQTINPHTGEKVCLSYRCADMDKEIPALMGVSKAILENVIFVHQDDSNWPVQDPSTLKKKFDDIFSATRYTKALEVIKKLHKEQAQEIKTYKLKLENLQTLKDAAYKLRDSISQDQEKSESLKAHMDELERDIQAKADKILHTETTLKELQKLEDQISICNTKRSTLYELQEQQYDALEEENEDTDEELKEWQTKFEEKIAILQSKISKLEREINDEEINYANLSKKINDSMLEIGKLQAEAAAHSKSMDERESRIQRILTEHNIGNVPKLPFSNEVVANLLKRIEIRMSDIEKDLQDRKTSDEMELKFLWEQYEKAHNKCCEIEADKQSKMGIMAGIMKRIEAKENERDIAEHELDSYNLHSIDKKEEKLKAEEEQKTTALLSRKFESTITDKTNEIYSLEQQILSLEQDRKMIDSDIEDRVILEMKKKELESCRKKMKKVMDESSNKIRSVLKGRLPSEKELKNEVFSALRSAKKEFDDLNSKTQSAEKEMDFFQKKSKETEGHLSTLKREMDAKRRFVESKLKSLNLASSDIDSFPKVLLQAMENKDLLKSKYSMANGMRQMFDPFERVAREHHFCPCCERPFSAEEEDDFVGKQRTKSATSAEQLRKIAASSSEAESHFQQLEKLRPIYEDYFKLGNEGIPSAERDLKDLSNNLCDKTQTYEELVGVLAHVETEMKAVEALVKPAETVERLLSDMENLRKQNDVLEEKLGNQIEGVKSRAEIELELTSKMKKKNELSKERESLRDEWQMLESDLKSVSMRYRSAREEKVKAKNIIDKLKKAEEDLISLAEEKSQVELDEKHLAEAIGPLLKEKEKLRQEYTELKRKLGREYDEQAEKKRNFQQEFDTVQKLSSKIKEYTDAGKQKRLHDLQEEIAVSESRLKKCKSRKEELSFELSQSKEVLATQNQVKRNIDDNLNYRKTKEEVGKLARQIDMLEDEKRSIGRMSTIETDLRRQMQEKDRLLAELNRCNGTLDAYESNISKHKLDLKQSQYTDIDKRYFHQLIQLKTSEMANKDLDKYYNALDKALMRFHSMKMEEINKIIRELWQQTYRGQDIDYISILSDSEGSGTRSYSYRVVMQTGDAELEMRGRCSAGQKVLASLIIRLALAETFCLHCGILALDEPTTNLDGPNAESLAAALLRIMEDRRGQENFQLIVITHDERFAQLIGQRQHAERYYRVTKDDLQHSIIEAQEIFD